MVEDIKGAALRRLRMLEGQVRGVSRMIDEERECIDVLTQIASLRAALDSLGSLLLSSQIEEFVSGLAPETASQPEVQARVGEFQEAVTKFLR